MDPMTEEPDPDLIDPNGKVEPDVPVSAGDEELPSSDGATADAGITREEIVSQLAAKLEEEGAGPVTAVTIAEIYATTWDFRVMLEQMRSLGGPGGLAAKLFGLKKVKG